MKPNRYDTATIVLLVGLLAAAFDPFVVAGITWIQMHTIVIFPAGYPQLLARILEVCMTGYSAHYHTTPAEPQKPEAQ